MTREPNALRAVGGGVFVTLVLLTAKLCWAQTTSDAQKAIDVASPSPWQQIVLQGLAVFLGVVAGIVVQVGAQRFFEWRAGRQDLNSLKFELRFDIRTIDRWLAEAQRWRNAVNANAMAGYFGYFDLSKFIYVTANKMFVSGALYRLLIDDDIAALQIITTEFSPSWENVLNNEITNMRQNFVQANAVTIVDFWEGKFRAHRDTLNRILNKLG